MHGVAGNLQRTAECRQKHADREHAGEQPFLIDAEGCDHVAVLRRRAHQNAPPRALKQQPQQAENDGAEADQKQIVGRNVLAEKIHCAAKSWRAPADEIVWSPDQYHKVFDHQG